MTGPEDATGRVEERGANERPKATVQPLERTAPVYVESREGYVDIRQPSGDPTLYTPEEAREIAHDILAAVGESERWPEE